MVVFREEEGKVAARNDACIMVCIWYIWLKISFARSSSRPRLQQKWNLSSSQTPKYPLRTLP